MGLTLFVFEIQATKDKIQGVFTGLAHCHGEIIITNFLLTEHKGRTGESWPKVVAVRTERSEVRTKTTEGQYSPVRLELARLVSSLLYGFLITFCFVFASP